MIAHCAYPGCDARAVFPSSRDHYAAEDPFPEPRPVGLVTLGWRSWADRSWCPVHAGVPERHEAAVREWESARSTVAEAAAREWENTHPRPTVPGGTGG